MRGPKGSQGPFCAEDIREYTQQTLSTGISNKEESTLIIMPLVMSPLIIGQNYQRHMMKQLVRSLGQETSTLLKLCSNLF